MKLERPVFEVRPPIDTLNVWDAMGYRFYDPLNVTQRKEKRKDETRVHTIGTHWYFGTDFNKLDSKARELIKRGFPSCWMRIESFIDDWTGEPTYHLFVADFDNSREEELRCDEDLQKYDEETYRYRGFYLNKRGIENGNKTN